MKLYISDIKDQSYNTGLHEIRFSYDLNAAKQFLSARYF